MSDADVKNNFPFLLGVPAEIIEIILGESLVTHADIAHVSQVCRKLNDICQDNELWRTKYAQRWPHMIGRYDRKVQYNWYEEFKHRHLIGCQVRHLVCGLSPKYFKREEVPKEEYSDFAKSLNHDRSQEFCIDELMSLIQEGNEGENLTQKYYAEKILRFAQQEHLRPKIQKYIEESMLPVKPHVELGACLIAQWCQPTQQVIVNEVLDQLDSLAMDVKNILRDSSPNHPVLGQELNENKLNDALWSCDQCRAILEAINTVMFVKHGFSGNTRNYYNQSNSYLDKVVKVKTGIPITLCIVYLAIARRLGVLCEPVNFPTHFLIKWKEHPLQTKDSMYTYIDVFNGGQFLTPAQLSAKFNVDSSVLRLEDGTTTGSEVLTRMLRNLVSIGRQQERMGDNLLCLRNALELSLLFCPDDFQSRLLLVRVNLHLNINLPEVVEMLHAIADEDQSRMGLVAYLTSAAQSQLEENKNNQTTKEIKVKRRKKPKDALFSVGLVMKHKRYNYSCVIYGWDEKCGASQEWIIQMGVNNLPHKDKQPFYNVLVEDGSNRYAAEENLEFHDNPCPIPHPEVENLEFHDNPCPIPHPEVGKYFTTYRRTHYLPNTEKATEYPDDTDLTRKLLQEREKQENH